MCNVASGRMVVMAVTVGNSKATSVDIYIYIYVNKKKAIPVEA